MTALPVEILNRTGHALAVEYEWEGMAGAFALAPEGARLVITITQLDRCKGSDGVG